MGSLTIIITGRKSSFSAVLSRLALDSRGQARRINNTYFIPTLNALIGIVNLLIYNQNVGMCRFSHLFFTSTPEIQNSPERPSSQE